MFEKQYPLKGDEVSKMKNLSCSLIVQFGMKIFASMTLKYAYDQLAISRGSNFGLLLSV